MTKSKKYNVYSYRGYCPFCKSEQVLYEFEYQIKEVEGEFDKTVHIYNISQCSNCKMLIPDEV